MSRNGLEFILESGWVGVSDVILLCRSDPPADFYSDVQNNIDKITYGESRSEMFGV